MSSAAGTGTAGADVWGAGDGGTKNQTGETGGWSELHPELLPSSTSVYYICILSETQTWIRTWVGLDRLSVRAPGVLASIAMTDAYLYF